MNREGSGMMAKPPIILARQEKHQDPSTMLPSPGAVSIMQRESSSVHLPNSPQIHPVMSTGMFPSHGGDSLPSSSGSLHHQSGIKHRDEGKGRNQRRQDNTSSNPSNYTPLQPGMRSGVRGETAGGHSRMSADHSLFPPTNEMTHSIKMIDRNLHWDDKGMDVSHCVMKDLMIAWRVLVEKCRRDSGGERWCGGGVKWWCIRGGVVWWCIREWVK